MSSKLILVLKQQKPFSFGNLLFTITFSHQDPKGSGLKVLLIHIFMRNSLESSMHVCVYNMWV